MIQLLYCDVCKKTHYINMCGNFFVIVLRDMETWVETHLGKHRDIGEGWIL